MPAIASEIRGDVDNLVREERAGTSGAECADDSALSPYELLSFIERRLHRAIREALVEEYGEESERWWREGIPLEIRKTCAQRREEDEDEPKHQYHYVTLVEIKTIIGKQWRVLEAALRAAVELFPRKRDWLGGLHHLNRVRRKVMHPARADEIPDVERGLLQRFYAAACHLSVREEETDIEEEGIPDWKLKLLELTAVVEEEEEEQEEEEETPEWLRKLRELTEDVERE